MQFATTLLLTYVRESGTKHMTSRGMTHTYIIDSLALGLQCLANWFAHSVAENRPAKFAPVN